MRMGENRMCTRCVFDDTVKNIQFDQDGVCNFCHLNEKFAKKPKKANVERLFARIKRKMRNEKYDCIVPFSGGLDSTYTLYYVKREGLRPIALLSDNGWISEISRQNMKKVVKKLEVPFISLSEDWETMRDLYLAFLKASVPEICTPCEVKSISEMTDFAAKQGIPYIIFGFSPQTEGFAPLTWHYIDSIYFKGIVKRFAQKKAAAFKLNKLSIFYFFHYILIKQIKYILLPSLIEWDKQEIKKTLEAELGWVDEGSHSDCLYYPVVRYIVKKKFNIDKQATLFSALINSGKMTREEAIKLLQKSWPEGVKVRIEHIIERLGITRQEFERLLSLKPKYFTDYPSYYPYFKKIKPFIWLTCKCHLLPNEMYDYFFNAG